MVMGLFAVCITLLCLVFPVPVTVKTYTNVIDKKIYLSFHFFGIRIISGNISLHLDGFQLSVLTFKKEIKYSKIIKRKKHIDFFTAFNLLAVKSIFQLGSNKSLFGCIISAEAICLISSTVKKLLSARRAPIILSNGVEIFESEDIFKINANISFVFSTLTLISAFIKQGVKNAKRK